MTIHPIRRLSTVALAVTVWVVLAAGDAQAMVGPDDRSAGFVTQPVFITEPSNWTRDVLLAATACLIGVAATLAVHMVLRRGRAGSAAHA